MGSAAVDITVQEVADVEFSAKEVAAHKTREDCWMTIHDHGKLIIPTFHTHTHMYIQKQTIDG